MDIKYNSLGTKLIIKSNCVKMYVKILKDLKKSLMNKEKKSSI